jgi:hypothetical protein
MQYLEGKKTYIFFALTLLVWLANQFGFGGFELNPAQAEWFDLIVIVGGFVLRKLTVGKPAI